MTLTTSACTHQSSSPAVPPLPVDCFGAPDGAGLATHQDDVLDPHGQGSVLLGLGLAHANVFVRIDSFDLQSIRGRNGLLITDARVDLHSHTLEGIPDWSGATLVGQAHCVGPGKPVADIKVTIRGLSTRRIGANVQTYDLEVEDHGKKLNACADQDDVAVPVNGFWDDAGVHILDGRFSFACAKRDVVTCLDEGYIDDPSDPTRYALFKACTRMLRADYCGDGGSYTRTGTFVTMSDNKRVAADDHLDPLVFEAAWSADGAVCMARPRWPDLMPACEKPVRECPPDLNRDTDVAAPPLLFNESCVDHPCQVTRTERAR